MTGLLRLCSPWLPALAVSCLLVLAGPVVPGAAHAAEGADPEASKPTEMPGYSTNVLRELAEAVQRTRLGRDKIPSLDRPQYLSIADANLSMENEEVVFVVHYPGDRVRIYPQRIMVWHEVVNDFLPDESGNQAAAMAYTVGDRPLGDSYSISYSPLTGSVVGFKSMAGKYPSSFGVSGMLLFDNTILYDRVSHSLWSQLMAACIEGPLRGKRLQRIQVTWATWRGVKERYGGLHPQFTGKAEVLSRSTGYKRSYGKDPYGNYHVPGNYYDNNQLISPVPHLDTRLPAKKRVLGIEDETAFGAVVVDEVKEQRVINFSLGLTPMVAVYDQELDAVRIFDRRLPERKEPLTFVIFEGNLVDEETRTEWFPTGRSVQGALRERELTQVLSVDAMWFAWASFYRGSMIIPGKEW